MSKTTVSGQSDNEIIDQMMKQAGGAIAFRVGTKLNESLAKMRGKESVSIDEAKHILYEETQNALRDGNIKYSEALQKYAEQTGTKISIEGVKVKVETTLTSKGVTKVGENAQRQIKYSTQEMLQKYVGEETGSIWGTKVKYLNEAERANLELFVKDGKIVDRHGNLYDTSSSSSVFGAGQGKSIFVMDKYGRIYASNYQSVGKFHHSSILGGKPISAAGEITVIKGKIIEISNRSGHYQPTQQMNSQIINELKSRGVNISSIKITGF